MWPLDFSQAWLHFAGHRVPFLWQFHRVHHSAEVLDSTTGLRMHALDFLRLWCVPFLFFSVVFDTSSFAPWVIPAAFESAWSWTPFSTATATFDLRKPWNRAWHRLLNNPHFHAWHHTRDGALCDGNYGNTLLIWDRLFGTEVTRSVLPDAYGLETDQALVNDVFGWCACCPGGEPRCSRRAQREGQDWRGTPGHRRLFARVLWPVDWSEAWTALSTVRWGLLVPVMGLYLVAHPFVRGGSSSLLRRGWATGGSSPSTPSGFWPSM